MMINDDDDVFNSLFHGCAVAAYADLLLKHRGEPDCDATKWLAYQYYEQALAEKNRKKSPLKDVA